MRSALAGKLRELPKVMRSMFPIAIQSAYGRCEGRHRGPDVILGRRYTDAECDAFVEGGLAEADAAVRRPANAPTHRLRSAPRLIDFIAQSGRRQPGKVHHPEEAQRGRLCGARAPSTARAKGRVNGRLQTLPGLQNRRRDADQWVCASKVPRTRREQVIDMNRYLIAAAAGLPAALVACRGHSLWYGRHEYAAGHAQAQPESSRRPPPSYPNNTAPKQQAASNKPRKILRDHRGQVPAYHSKARRRS